MQICPLVRKRLLVFSSFGKCLFCLIIIIIIINHKSKDLFVNQKVPNSCQLCYVSYVPNTIQKPGRFRACYPFRWIASRRRRWWAISGQSPFAPLSRPGTSKKTCRKHPKQNLGKNLPQKKQNPFHHCFQQMSLNIPSTKNEVRNWSIA